MSAADGRGDIVRVPSGSEVRVLVRIQKAAVPVWNAAALGGVGAPAYATACGMQSAVAGGLAVLLYGAMTISFQSEVKKLESCCAWSSVATRPDHALLTRAETRSSAEPPRLSYGGEMGVRRRVVT